MRRAAKRTRKLSGASFRWRGTGDATMALARQRELAGLALDLQNQIANLRIRVDLGHNSIAGPVFPPTSDATAAPIDSEQTTLASATSPKISPAPSAPCASGELEQLRARQESAPVRLARLEDDLAASRADADRARAALLDAHSVDQRQQMDARVLAAELGEAERIEQTRAASECVARWRADAEARQR